jgi:hypothetical protein
MAWFSEWRKKHRRKKELKALEALEVILSVERSRIGSISRLVKKIIGNVENDDLSEAEKGASKLINRMRQKKMMDRIEEKDLKIFKKTILKELSS